MALDRLNRDVVHEICTNQVVVTLHACVKELVENALDAGATRIEVRFRESGSELLEVVDNGHGIATENYSNLATRHATSKIREFDDLSQSLSTFGFRGEALAAIAAMGDLSVCTRTATDTAANLLAYDKMGKLTSQAHAAREVGTTVSVRELFARLPVRHREFMRNAKAQVSAAIRLIQAYAIARPEIVFHVVGERKAARGAGNNGRATLLSTSGSSRGWRQAAAAVLGDAVVSDVEQLQLQSEKTGWMVAGLISTPHGGRRSKDAQLFFVNQRPIDPPKRITKLINDTYHQYNSRMWPVIILSFTAAQDLVDVNVTPDKRTVLLHNEEDLLAELQQALTEKFAPASRGPGAALADFGIRPLSRVAPLAAGSTPGAASPGPESQKEDARTPDGAGGSRNAAVVSAAVPAAVLGGPLETPEKTDAPAGDSQGSDSCSSALPELKVTEFLPASVVPDSANSQRFESVGRNDDSDLQGLCVTEFTVDSEPSALPLESCTGSSFLDGNGGQSISHSGAMPNAASPKVWKKQLQRRYSNEGEDVGMIPLDLSDAAVEAPLLDPRSSIAKTPSLGTKACAGDTDINEGVTDLPQVGAPDADDEDVFAELADMIEAEKEAQVREGHINAAILPSGTVEEDDGMIIEDYIPESMPPTAVAAPLPNSSEQSSGHSAPSLSALPQSARSLPTLPSEASVPPATLGGTVRASTSMAELAAAVARRRRCHESKITPATPASVAPSVQFPSAFSLASLGAGAHAGGAAATPSLDEVARFGATGGAGSAEDPSAFRFDKDCFTKMRVIGQFNLGFIITALRARVGATGDEAKEEDANQGLQLFIVDQHASDEKFRFEGLNRSSRIDRQPLVTPYYMQLTPAQEALAASNLEVFKLNGFEVKHDEQKPPGRRLQLSTLPTTQGMVFSEKDVHELLYTLEEVEADNSRPSTLDASQKPGQEGGGLLDLAGHRALWSSTAVPRPPKVWQLLACRACRGAIMIGKALRKSEMERILLNLSSLQQPWNCPHGRPTMRHLGSTCLARRSPKPAPPLAELLRPESSQ